MTMFLLVVVFVIVGDFIEPVPAIIIFMPVVNALTEQASINAVHMGVVLIVTLAFRADHAALRAGVADGVEVPGCEVLARR